MEKKKSIIILREYLSQVQNKIFSINKYWGDAFGKIIQRFNIVLQIVPPYITVFIFKKIVDLYQKEIDDTEIGKKIKLIINDMLIVETSEKEPSKATKEKIVLLLFGLIADVKSKKSLTETIRKIQEDEEYLLFFDYWISLLNK